MPQNKETVILTTKMIWKKLQGLVGKIMDYEKSISEGEEKNRQLWASKVEFNEKATHLSKPLSYVSKQYEKNKKLDT